MDKFVYCKMFDGIKMWQSILEQKFITVSKILFIIIYLINWECFGYQSSIFLIFDCNVICIKQYAVNEKKKEAKRRK